MSTSPKTRRKAPSPGRYRPARYRSARGSGCSKRPRFCRDRGPAGGRTRRGDGPGHVLLRSSSCDPKTSPRSSGGLRSARPVTALAGLDLGRLGVEEVFISETMRLSTAGAEFLAIWEPAEDRGRRPEGPAAKCPFVLRIALNELEHAASHCRDGALEFEDALTRRLGTFASAALSPQVPVTS